MFVSENERPLLKFTQDSKFLTKTALEDLGFQAKICTDPELRSPAEIRTELFLLIEENEWSLSSSESPGQEDQPTNQKKNQKNPTPKSTQTNCVHCYSLSQNIFPSFCSRLADWHPIFCVNRNLAHFSYETLLKGSLNSAIRFGEISSAL